MIDDRDPKTTLPPVGNGLTAKSVLRQEKKETVNVKRHQPPLRTQARLYMSAIGFLFALAVVLFLVMDPIAVRLFPQEQATVETASPTQTTSTMAEPLPPATVEKTPPETKTESVPKNAPSIPTVVVTTPNSVAVSNGDCKARCTLEDLSETGIATISCPDARWHATTLQPIKGGKLARCYSASKLTAVEK